MGIRSDVAVALKKEVFDNLSAKSRKTLDEWFVQPASVSQDGHVLFYEEHIKWYNTSDNGLINLYSELVSVFDDEDYLIVEACHDYPESTEGNVGGWYENPWDIIKNYTVSLEWDEEQAFLHVPPATPVLPTPNEKGA
tara:strand:- start:775 stop:1188 length:414 start_codon:yes stop_codon:yes gene_type:complete